MLTSLRSINVAADDLILPGFIGLTKIAAPPPDAHDQILQIFPSPDPYQIQAALEALRILWEHGELKPAENQFHHRWTQMNTEKTGAKASSCPSRNSHRLARQVSKNRIGSESVPICGEILFQLHGSGLGAVQN